jgi:hypothetical protein
MRIAAPPRAPRPPVQDVEGLVNDECELVVRIDRELREAEIRRLLGRRTGGLQQTAELLSQVGRGIGNHQRPDSLDVARRVLAVELDEPGSVPHQDASARERHRPIIGDEARWRSGVIDEHVLLAGQVEEDRRAGGIPAGPDGVLPPRDQRPHLRRFGDQPRVDPKHDFRRSGRLARACSHGLGPRHAGSQQEEGHRERQYASRHDTPHVWQLAVGWHEVRRRSAPRSIG